MLSFELNSVAFNFPIHVVFYVCVAYAMGFALLRCVLCYIQALIRNWLHTIISNIMIVDGGGAGVVVVAMSSLSPWTICYQINIPLLSTLLFTSMRFNVQCSLCRVKSWKHKHPPIKFNVRKFPIFQQQNRNFSFNFHTYTNTHTHTHVHTFSLEVVRFQLPNDEHIFFLFEPKKHIAHSSSICGQYLLDRAYISPANHFHLCTFLLAFVWMFSFWNKIFIALTYTHIFVRFRNK